MTNKANSELIFPVYVGGISGVTGNDRTAPPLLDDVNAFEMAPAIMNIIMQNNVENFRVYGLNINLGIQNNPDVIETELVSPRLYFHDYSLSSIMNEILAVVVVHGGKILYRNDDTPRLIHYFCSYEYDRNILYYDEYCMEINSENVNNGSLYSIADGDAEEERWMNILAETLKTRFKYPVLLRFVENDETHVNIVDFFDLLASLLYKEEGDLQARAKHPYLPDCFYDITSVIPIRTHMNKDSFDVYLSTFKILNQLTLKAERQLGVDYVGGHDHTFYGRMPLRVLIGEDHELGIVNLNTLKTLTDIDVGTHYNTLFIENFYDKSELKFVLDNFNERFRLEPLQLIVLNNQCIKICAYECSKNSKFLNQLKSNRLNFQNFLVMLWSVFRANVFIFPIEFNDKHVQPLDCSLQFFDDLRLFSRAARRRVVVPHEVHYVLVKPR